MPHPRRAALLVAAPLLLAGLAACEPAAEEEAAVAEPAGEDEPRTRSSALGKAMDAAERTEREIEAYQQDVQDAADRVFDRGGPPAGSGEDEDAPGGG